MAERLFMTSEKLARFIRDLLSEDEDIYCCCARMPQAHGGTFHPRCKLHHKQAAALNPTEQRQRTIFRPQRRTP
jgi:hypothetical protein